MIAWNEKQIARMTLPEMWQNYLEAMDETIRYVEAGNRGRAEFFAAIVKVTLDIYFNEIERVRKEYETHLG